MHLSLEQKGATWALAVATLEHAVCSRTSAACSRRRHEILRGHAFTNPNGLVLDAFEFTDEEQFFELNRDAQDQVLRVMQDVVSGRADVTARLRAGTEHPPGEDSLRFSPVVHTDNKASGRYTILDIVTGNALGLLYRISRVISQHGCDVDLV